MLSNGTWPADYEQYSGQPLVNVYISFAIFETFFIVAFIISWYFNNNSSNNNKLTLCIILTGYIFCFGGVVIGTLKITVAGAGYHADTLRKETVERMLKLVKVHEFVYILSIPYPKLAILCLYFRIFKSQLAKALLYLTGLVVLATCLFGVIAAFANCRPFTAFWNTNQVKHCTMDTMSIYRYYSVPNIVTDVLMVLIPIPTLWRLQMDLLVKIGIFITFFLSTIGIVGAILRFISFLEVDMFDDITYLGIWPGCWTIIEPGLYLVAATVPTLRPLVRRIIKAANEFCPITKAVVNCYRDTCNTTDTTASNTNLAPRQLSKKPSTRQMETIVRRPSRGMLLDDYHRVQYNEPLTPRSMEEESMVCEDAVITETMSRQGRNRDGTLVTWSLQPVHVSPFRTSFVMREKARLDRRTA